MRRLGCACAVSCAVLAAAVAGATASALPARLTGSVCRAASNPLDRKVAITAVMRPVAGTARMALMFQLQEQPPGGGPFTIVRGGDLGRWRRSPATLGNSPNDVWRVNKPVRNLPAPAIYRFRVSFRWRSASGLVLGRVVRYGPTCYQPR